MNFQSSTYQNLITSLLLNGNFIQNTGLMHGKTGLTILFYHLAKANGNPAFENFANELVDDICTNLTSQMPADFENGLEGIGWGMEYLIQNGFLEADADEVLEEFDKQIFRKFLENTPANIGLLNGILGTGYYFLMRSKNSKQKQESILSKTNELALLQIINHIRLVLPETDVLIKEPQKSITSVQKESINQQQQSVPVFDSTWELPLLIGFLAELDKKPTGFESLVVKLLTSLKSDSNLPVLQCNKRLLLLSLSKLKNSLQKDLFKSTENSKDPGIREILCLTGEVITKLILSQDDEKYTNEIKVLDLTIRNGIAGMALIHKKLYEENNDVNYKREYESLLSRIESDSFINQFRYDYSNPLPKNEQQLGILQGISGLLIASLLGEINPQN